ncbi:hypothetical protein LWE61_14825 [Sphingobium sufflavum]|uniref:hypothetical protein n=1 Tax=Sphingobium sufflavum TaxID=1129547 RepID=UPI001F37DAFD|nr:hypothetical protein [Sphingobium sufflavum]MCE7797823.1 hypothetical protein [Sphingobium sufflavum]
MMISREDAERARKRADQKRDTSVIGIGGAIFLVLAAFGIYLFVTAQPDEKPVVPYSSNMVMSDSLQCDRLVEISRREGIVKGERAGNRIRVDEKRWAAMTDEGRRNLLQYVACAAFAGRGLDALDDGETVVAIGAASRKVVASAGRDGMKPAPSR